MVTHLMTHCGDIKIWPFPPNGGKTLIGQIRSRAPCVVDRALVRSTQQFNSPLSLVLLPFLTKKCVSQNPIQGKTSCPVWGVQQLSVSAPSGSVSGAESYLVRGHSPPGDSLHPVADKQCYSGPAILDPSKPQLMDNSYARAAPWVR